jgi:hypothetical protein
MLKKVALGVVVLALNSQANADKAWVKSAGKAPAQKAMTTPAKNLSPPKTGHPGGTSTQSKPPVNSGVNKLNPQPLPP